jgi:hypothetical protein
VKPRDFALLHRARPDSAARGTPRALARRFRGSSCFHRSMKRIAPSTNASVASWPLFGRCFVRIALAPDAGRRHLGGRRFLASGLRLEALGQKDERRGPVPGRVSARRAEQFEYRCDRMLPATLEQAYQLLVPDQQARRPLCSRVIGPSAGERDHRKSDGHAENERRGA